MATNSSLRETPSCAEMFGPVLINPPFRTDLNKFLILAFGTKTPRSQIFPCCGHTSTFFWAHVCPRGSVHRLFGDVRSQPSLNLRAGRDASCRTHCGVRTVPNHAYQIGRAH